MFHDGRMGVFRDNTMIIRYSVQASRLLSWQTLVLRILHQEGQAAGVPGLAELIDL